MSLNNAGLTQRSVVAAASNAGPFVRLGAAIFCFDQQPYIVSIFTLYAPNSKADATLTWAYVKLNVDGSRSFAN